MTLFPGRVAVFAAALAGMAALQTPATAQTPPADSELAQKFAGFATSPAYFHFLQERLPQLEPAPLAATCSDIKPIQRKRLVVLAAPVFGADAKQPSSGVWVDQIRVSRCGSEVVRNLLIAVKDTNLQLAALLPGGTDTTPALQRDSMPAAEMQAQQAGKCSEKMVVVDTRIEGELKAGAPWLETWTFQGCGDATVDVAMTFTPDGKGGTTYTASAKR